MATPVYAVLMIPRHDPDRRIGGIALEHGGDHEPVAGPPRGAPEFETADARAAGAHRTCGRHRAVRTDKQVAAYRRRQRARAREPLGELGCEGAAHDAHLASEALEPFRFGVNLRAVAALLDSRDVRLERHGVSVEAAESLRIARIAEHAEHRFRPVPSVEQIGTVGDEPMTVCRLELA